MRNENEGMAISLGAIGAVLLGMALTPLRGLTPAANFTFVFMALTIVVAEVGGRRAAVVTALSSALSLDFFLTEPYLKLTIAGKDDVVAFVGLTACGLVAAAFGATHERHEARSRYLDLLEGALAQTEAAAVDAPAIGRALDSARSLLPVAALAVRDADGDLIAATTGARRPATVVSLSADTLLPTGHWAQQAAGPSGSLPPDGARLALFAGSRSVGFLEIWGDGSPADATERRVLSCFARALAADLAVGMSQPQPR
jgi:K+-sensing histidine kinase KdpD